MRGLCKSSSPSTVVSPKGGTRGPSFNAKQVIQTSCSQTDALTSRSRRAGCLSSRDERKRVSIAQQRGLSTAPFCCRCSYITPDALTSCSYTTHTHDAHTRVPLSLMLFY